MLEFRVEEDEGMRLDRWLAVRLPERSRSQIQHDLEAGHVLVNDEQRQSRYAVATGDRITYEVPGPPETRLQPEAIPLTILFEDEHLIVIDKPAGMVVHPAPGHQGGTVANALLGHCGPGLVGVGGEGRWGIVHRLDNLTSGLMLAAKTGAAYHRLVAMLGEREIRRRYLGIAIGSFKTNEGIIEAPIGRRSSDRKLMGVVPHGQPARTDWRLLLQGHGVALLALALHSGRTHQIRVHLQSIGHSVFGDPEYGWSKARTLQEMGQQKLRTQLEIIWPGRQMLHAAILSLEHPIETGRQLRFESPPPPDMAAVLDVLWGEDWKTALEAWFRK